MIVDGAVYRDGIRLDAGCAPEDFNTLRDYAAEHGGFVWVGLMEPTEYEMKRVARAFHLHHLAVEDALHAHQRPKLEHYDDMLFVILRSLWYVDETDAVETGQVALYVGTDFIVTVRHGEGNELASARRDLESQSALLGHGPSAVLYAVIDRIVDSYETVMQGLEKDVDEVEESVFSPERTKDSQRIYVLKRELAEVRRAVLPLRAPVQEFASASVGGVAPESAPFFRDVADHLARVVDWSETLDSLLSTAFDAHIARIQVQQNEDMRKISAWVALAAVSTLIAGVYGMNFHYMPELSWHYGYFGALGLMAVSSLVLYRLFRKYDWL